MRVWHGFYYKFLVYFEWRKGPPLKDGGLLGALHVIFHKVDVPFALYSSTNRYYLFKPVYL